jgi:hypothetical protein
MTFRHGAIALLLLALSGALAWACRGVFTPGYFNDDAEYGLGAIRMAAHLGRGTINPQLDSLEAGHLPGESLLLLPAAWLTAGNIDAMRFENMVFALVSIVLFAALASLYVPRPQAALVGLCSFYCAWAVPYSTTMLSDVPFSTIVALVLFLLEQANEGTRRPSGALLLGMLCGLSMLVRFPGIILIMMLILFQAKEAGRRALLWSMLGIAVLTVPHFAIHRSGTGANYFDIAAEQLGSSGLLYTQLATWWKHLPTLVGTNLLGVPPLGCEWLPTWVGAVCGVLWLAAAACGWWQLGEKPGGRLRPLPLFTVAYALLMMLWPYADVRFYLLWWPLLLVLGAYGLSSRSPRLASGFLVISLLLGASSLPAQLKWSRSTLAIADKATASYRWIRDNTPADAIIAAPDYWHCMLLTRRRAWAYPAASTSTLLDLVTFSSRDGASYILVQPEVNFDVDSHGAQQAQWLRRSDLWLDESTLVKRVFATDYDRVYHIEVDRIKLLTAYQHFLAAQRLRGNAPEAAEAELRETLRLVPDVPAARLALGKLLLKRDPKNGEGVEMIFSVARQYPVDVDAVILAARLMAAYGAPDRGIAVLRDNLQRCKLEERPQDATRVEQALRALQEPPR